MNSAAAPSLIDVAKRAGVSMATASRALNDAYGVSATTRAKVLAAAEELDFVASPDASRLARGGTGRVAIVVPHLERWFFGEMVGGIERVLSGAGLDTLLYHVDGIDDRRDFLLRLPARRKVDAVVVVAFPVDDEGRRRLELIGAKIVAAGGQTASYPFVSIDDYQAGRLAVEHLAALGHRRIAMIAGMDPDQPGWPSISGRSRAYEDVVRELALDEDPALVETIEWSPHNASEAMARILDAPGPRPTAVFTHSDEIAFGVLGLLQERGLRPGQDLSVVGIDDHPLSETFGLSTVAQDVQEQARIVGEMVLEELGLRTPPVRENRSVITATRLIVRGSTQSPPAPAPRRV